MNKNDNLKESILKSIEEGKVEMKPKMFFVGKTVAYTLAVVIVLLVTLFLISFVLFTLRAQGLFLLPEFGFRGLLPLMLSIPWLLVILVIAFVGALEVLARNFTFVYRKPLVYSVLGIIVLTVFAGGAIAASPLHQRLYDRAEERGIPFGGTRLYNQFNNADLKGGHAGTIEEINSGGFIIETKSGRKISVSTTTKTKYPENSNLQEGSLIMVVGDQKKDSFEAFGIRVISEDERPFLHRQFRPGPDKRPGVPRTFQDPIMDINPKDF